MSGSSRCPFTELATLTRVMLGLLFKVLLGGTKAPSLNSEPQARLSTASPIWNPKQLAMTAPVRGVCSLAALELRELFNPYPTGPSDLLLGSV